MPRLCNLLDHFAAAHDPPEPVTVPAPLPEVLLVVTRSICDDRDEVVGWGETHLAFLRRFPAFPFGIPGADWPRVVTNRIDPALCPACRLVVQASSLRGISAAVAR